MVKKIALALMLSACLVFAVGCAAKTTTDTTKVNRQYMSSVNQIMDNLASDLDEFNDAVKDSDPLRMALGYEKASKDVGNLHTLTVPDALKDIHEQYVSGTTKLCQALQSYMDLFTAIEEATEENPFDYSTYDATIASIQATYDEGIDALKSADEAAAALETTSTTDTTKGNATELTEGK